MSRPAGSRCARAVSLVAAACLAVSVLLACGCTTLEEWIHNGFKVGPNFCPPPSPVASDWIESADVHVVRSPLQAADWWTVFGDPVLSGLIETAYRQNLDLKTAVMRVLEAQAQRNISAGNLFPQTQEAAGTYLHAQLSKNLNFVNSVSLPGGPSFGIPTSINVWSTGFTASWELDLWGRYRRAVESSNAQLDASVEGYHDALVTLVADVATAYVQTRTFQQRIAYARRNVELQRGSLELVQARLREGSATGLDVAQAESNVAQTASSIPPLVIGLRQANDRLCILLGEPVHELSLAEEPIPKAPPEVAVGIPAELLDRRPDVRQARLQAAAQSAQIGVAEADYYPSIGVAGFIGYAADDIRHLFEESSFTGLILPNFQWKILNYGRIVNNVRVQDSRFGERVLRYQQTVLTAGREVEDALVQFLQYQVQARELEQSVRAAQRSVDLVIEQYRAGRADFNRVYTTQSVLVTQQDQLAAVEGNIALSLIGVYRALGGGWQYFEHGPGSGACATPAKLTGVIEEAPMVPPTR